MPKTFFKIIVLLIFIISCPNYLFAKDDRVNEPLYVVFLIDSSGSMKNTDPKEIRKLACQSIVSLLSPNDKVAVVEFDSEARILSDWKDTYDIHSIYKAFDSLRNDGVFTDFRAGLDAAQKMFKGIPQDARKVVLLLSDGILEPNLDSDKYAPFNLQYNLEKRGKTKDEISSITAKYTDKVLPIAKKQIDTDILPLYKSNSIEIFSIGFSKKADMHFLRHLAYNTSKNTSESHYFYVENAIELIDTFTILLHNWRNKIKVYTDKGIIEPLKFKKIAFDNYFKDMSLVVVTEHPSVFSISSVQGSETMDVITGTHKNLKIFKLKKPSGEWAFQFTDGKGAYRMLAIGESYVGLEVIGIKETYLLGEALNIVAIPKYANEYKKSFFGTKTRIEAEIISEEIVSEDRVIKQLLSETDKGYILKFTPLHTGSTKIRFTLYAYDKNGLELMPRPSKEFAFKVMPRFFVNPDFVDFGNVKKGENIDKIINIVSGMPQTINGKLVGRINKASRCLDEKARLPVIKEAGFSINRGKQLEHKLTLITTEETCWGHFEGQIDFISEQKVIYSIGFRAHIPSWQDKLTYLTLFLIVIAFLILIALSIFWGNLKSPVGVLRPLRYPTNSNALSDIKLSSVKRGILKKWLHWKKNIIYIGSTNSDITLNALPTNTKLELVFHRFGGDYIRNISPKGSDIYILVRNPYVNIDIERGPGSSYQLTNGLKIKIGEYEFEYLYQNIK